MDNHYTISQFARAAGIPSTTLRYYERVGLVHPTRRAENNYRVYTAATLQTIRFIRAAQAAGLTLENIPTLLELCAEDVAACKDVQPLLAKRLDEVSKRMAEMRRVQRLLQSLLVQCHAQDQNELCHIIETFTTSA